MYRSRDDGLNTKKTTIFNLPMLNTTAGLYGNTKRWRSVFAPFKPTPSIGTFASAKPSEVPIATLHQGKSDLARTHSLDIFCGNGAPLRAFKPYGTPDICPTDECANQWDSGLLFCRHCCQRNQHGLLDSPPNSASNSGTPSPTGEGACVDKAAYICPLDACISEWDNGEKLCAHGRADIPVCVPASARETSTEKILVDNPDVDKGVDPDFCPNDNCTTLWENGEPFCTHGQTHCLKCGFTWDGYGQHPPWDCIDSDSDIE